jgi:hypothetical protein
MDEDQLIAPPPASRDESTNEELFAEMRRYTVGDLRYNQLRGELERRAAEAQFRAANAQVRSARLQAAAVIAMFLSVVATLLVGH